MKPSRKHTFGPVPSRRLGRSLGIDLVPFKTCSFDCVYCQLGRTTCHTLERRTWVPVESVLAEVRTVLEEKPGIDYLTLSGSGEPTLHADLAEIIAGIRALTSLPIAALTNGALLWQPEVRQALRGADLVIPSLDAGTEAVFQRINRPAAGLSWGQVVDGIVAFRREFAGPIWLEVFLVQGLNDAPAELNRMAALARRIAPERIQLNTVTRPPAESSARPVPPAELRAIAARFGDRAEVVAGHAPTAAAGPAEPDLPALLRRRPCTLEDLTAATGLHPAELTKRLGWLDEAGLLVTRTVGGRHYYSALPIATSPPPTG